MPARDSTAQKSGRSAAARRASASRASVAAAAARAARTSPATAARAGAPALLLGARGRVLARNKRQRVHAEAGEGASDEDASMARRDAASEDEEAAESSSSDDSSSGDEGSSAESSSSDDSSSGDEGSSASSRSTAGSAESEAESADEAQGGGVEEAQGGGVEEAQGGGVEEAQGGGVEAADQRQRRPYKPRALITDQHQLSPLRKCTHGCGATVWPEEGTLCCSGGKHILGPQYNPPIDAEYLALLQKPHMSKDSRLINGALQLGTLSVSPSRAMGGMGFHEQHCAFLALYGRTYLALYDPSKNNAFDNHLLPFDLLLDGATADLGRDYAERLLCTRKYLALHHPLSRHLATIADLPGDRVDLNPYMRLEAHSLRSNAMELAFVSSGARCAEDRPNRVLYFDLRLHEQGRAPQTVDRHNALYDLLMFPMLHEKGIGGFFKAKGSRVESTTGAPLTLQFYTRSMLLQNERLHYLGRLAQEYVLVQHSRAVEDTLAYQRTGGLQTVLKRRRDLLPPKPGQNSEGTRVALTASVVGSRKYLDQQIDDSCAVANMYGNGTLWITMTCNPKWPEITSALLPGQMWEDRADVVNRVFRLKLQAFVEDLRSGAFFKDKRGKPWKAKYTMHVIEFQKRGKPHGHIVVRLAGPEEDMPKTGAAVDALISARLPVVDKECACSACSRGGAPCIQQRKLDAVKKHMMHKCAVGVCMKKEEPRVCMRGFPKAACAETTTDDGGYPQYVRGVCDEFVVSHNADMLLKYDCHINVELCSTVWVHKYMHKYMHKGPDSVRMVTKDLYQNLKNAGMNMEDDALKFQTFRYLSAGEALCRTFGFNLSQSTVGCSRLGVHKEDEDWVGDGTEARGKPSTLVKYFARPAALADYKYLDYYTTFNVQEATAAQREAAAGEQPYKPRRGNAYYLDGLGNKVAQRSRGSLHVARMYTVSVSKGEQYYLRMLLTSVPAMSFEELRTVGGVVHETYREAAEARGLLSVEREFADALGYMAKGLGTALTTIADLRHTFVMMAVAGGEGVPVLHLYRQFRYMMALDIDVSGAISPPGKDKGPVHVRLPVVEYEEGEEYNLDQYPVHEYHLLRTLDTLLQKNYSRTLEDLGLPSLHAHAARRRRGAAAPYLQLMLEGYLYAEPEAEDALYVAHGAGEAPRAVQAAAPPPPVAAQLQLLRATYVNNYPKLLTGPLLQRLLLEADHLGQIGLEAAFFREVDVEEEGATFIAMYETLNHEQKAFVDKACKCLQHQVVRREALKNRTPLPDIPDSECFLHLQARGGRGKSYVTKCIIAKALHLRLIPCVSSFAGIAAILLPLGQTCHKTYGLSLDTSNPAPSTLTTRSAQGAHLAETSLHIIDEADCLHKYLAEAASSVTARCVKDRYGVTSNKPFGGAMVLLVADKHQTLPICKGITNDDITIASMVRSSQLFSHFCSSELTIAQRAKDDPAYDAWLEQLSTNRAPGPVPLVDGELPPTVRRVFIPEQCFQTTSLDDALTWLFGPVPPPEGPFPELNPRYALLATLNKTVDAVNDLVLDRYVDGQLITLEAAHEACKDVAGAEEVDGISRTHATQEYMRGLTQSGVPAATLRLKKGCIMILTRNMLSTLGLVNGTRLRLLSDPPPDGTPLSLLHVETVGLEQPTRHFIPRIIFELITPGGLKFVRRQFPVRLAYAFTGNKAQGQTILKAVCDSRHENFAHGTAYVANSRTTSYATLGFLHAPLPEHEAEGRPTFINHVLQRALAPGVLVGAARPPALHRMGDGLDMNDDSSAEEESTDGEGSMAEADAPRARRVRAPAPASSAAVFQKGALSLTQRRTDTHERVKEHYAREE